MTSFSSTKIDQNNDGFQIQGQVLLLLNKKNLITIPDPSEMSNYWHDNVREIASRYMEISFLLKQVILRLTQFLMMIEKALNV